MKTLTVAMILAGLFTVGIAEAKKPAICMAFTETTLPVDGVATKVAICTDGKKPVVLVSYTVTTVKGEDGANVKAVVGWK